jgi:hypothetical protein
MGEKLIDDEKTYRELVIGLVGVLASVSEQRRYQLDVSELRCQWFDDLYHPDDGIWTSLFTPPELAAMAVFNSVFIMELSHLDRISLRDAPKSTYWQKVVNAAASAHKLLCSPQTSK